MTMTARRIALSLILAATATTTMSHDAPDCPGKDDGASRLFSVPFNIGSSGLTPSSVVRGKVTLKRPAILESYQGSCIGGVNYGTLDFDAGPRGPNGAAVAPLLTTSAAELLTDPLHGQQVLTFTKAGATTPFDGILPPTHLGVPIKSEVDMDLYLLPGADARCQMLLIFRAID